MGEALLERHELALGRSVVALGEDRHRAADFQGSIDVPEEGFVAMVVAVNGDEAAGLADDEPLHLARDQDGGVGEEMDAGLDRKQEEQRELVRPVEGVVDYYLVSAFGVVLPS